MFYRQLSFLMSLGAIAVLGGNLSSLAQTIPIVPNTTTSRAETTEEKGTQTIKLYYFRDAATLKTILNEVKTQEKWDMTIQTSSDDEIILYGKSAERKSAYRVIAAMDLPVPVS